MNVKKNIINLLVTGGEKSSLNRNLNPPPLAYCASALTTELCWQWSHTLRSPVTHSPSLKKSSPNSTYSRRNAWSIFSGLASNVTGGKELSQSRLNWGSLSYQISALTTELLRPNTSTDSHTWIPSDIPVNKVISVWPFFHSPWPSAPAVYVCQELLHLYSSSALLPLRPSACLCSSHASVACAQSAAVLSDRQKWRRNANFLYQVKIDHFVTENKTIIQRAGTFRDSSSSEGILAFLARAHSSYTLGSWKDLSSTLEDSAIASSLS